MPCRRKNYFLAYIFTVCGDLNMNFEITAVHILKSYDVPLLQIEVLVKIFPMNLLRTRLFALYEFELEDYQFIHNDLLNILFRNFSVLISES